MANRGFVGFVTDNTEKITYVHDESRPQYLGRYVLAWLRRRAVTDGLVSARRKAAALRLVGHDDTPTPADAARLARWTDLNVSKQSTADWYCLLRHTQGRPSAILQAGVAIDASDVPLDSVWTEWGYLLDFDTNRFEVYRGSQYQPHTEGRFASRTPFADANDGFDCYSCALVAAWPLTALPTCGEFMDAYYSGFKPALLVSA
ncbi:MAG TPA: hypothetical protein VFC19_36420 [Candidatus Limnocylindrales bacterium]|nr:hypothetical protein [Candidatus Limnocylindrales bacterium]